MRRHPAFRLLLFVLVPLFVLSSCTTAFRIEQRKYRPGFYINMPGVRAEKKSGTEEQRKQQVQRQPAAGPSSETAFVTGSIEARPVAQVVETAVPATVAHPSLVKHPAYHRAITEARLRTAKFSAAHKMSLAAHQKKSYTASHHAASNPLGVLGIIAIIVLVVLLIVAIDNAINDVTDVCCSIYDIY